MLVMTHAQNLINIITKTILGGSVPPTSEQIICLKGQRERASAQALAVSHLRVCVRAGGRVCAGMLCVHLNVN